jgi:hypothetical protein
VGPSGHWFVHTIPEIEGKSRIGPRLKSQTFVLGRRRKAAAQSQDRKKETTAVKSFLNRNRCLFNVGRESARRLGSNKISLRLGRTLIEIAHKF